MVKSLNGIAGIEELIGEPTSVEAEDTAEVYMP